MNSRFKKNILFPFFYVFNRCISKKNESIMFIPHHNSKNDNYDLLNGDSDNVLCLLNNLLRDHDYDNYSFHIGYYNENKLNEYIEYCKDFHPERLVFFKVDDYVQCNMSLCKCSLIFTDETFNRYRIKTSLQKIVCLNYYAGFMKNDFFRISENGGYQKMVKEQKDMHINYDKILSTSDLCSMFLTVEDCMYFGDILPLGFPRNDVFYKDNSELRSRIEIAIGFPFKHIFTYVPTHRDYESKNNNTCESKTGKRSIFGPATDKELADLNQMLELTQSIIIVKVHPVQARHAISNIHSKRVIFYHDLVFKVRTSLNPLMAVSDFLITDYTTAVYDFMHTNRPVIYYFYDYEKYIGTRGFFINPIDPICVGPITYNIAELCESIKNMVQGIDVHKTKRDVLTDLLCKYRDGNSTNRIKQYFLKTS